MELIGLFIHSAYFYLSLIHSLIQPMLSDCLAWLRHCVGPNVARDHHLGTEEAEQGEGRRWTPTHK